MVLLWSIYKRVRCLICKVMRIKRSIKRTWTNWKVSRMIRNCQTQIWISLLIKQVRQKLTVKKRRKSQIRANWQGQSRNLRPLKNRDLRILTCGRDTMIASFVTRKVFRILRAFSFPISQGTSLLALTRPFKFGDMNWVQISLKRDHLNFRLLAIGRMKSLESILGAKVRKDCHFTLNLAKIFFSKTLLFLTRR